MSPREEERPLLEGVTQQRDEDTADWEELMRAVLSCKVCELVVVTSLKESYKSNYQSEPRI
jgi:hypothetical protein